MSSCITASSIVLKPRFTFAWNSGHRCLNCPWLLALADVIKGYIAPPLLHLTVGCNSAKHCQTLCWTLLMLVWSVTNDRSLVGMSAVIETLSGKLSIHYLLATCYRQKRTTTHHTLMFVVQLLTESLSLWWLRYGCVGTIALNNRWIVPSSPGLI